MSEHIGHECGLALLRLRHPLAYYRDKYGDAAWGMRRLFLLMEKQRNRGQDGAGIAVAKYDMPAGRGYLNRVRCDQEGALERVFDQVLEGVPAPSDPQWKNADLAELKMRCEYLGELYMGHLRYATHSDTSIANCHPRVRKHYTASKCLALAGNFNMTNSPELFQQLIEFGLSPVGDSDTQVVLERLGYSLDREHDRLARDMGPGSFRGLEGRELAEAISQELDLVHMLSRASEPWDGGYVFGGILGNGDAFVCRDPAGIRPGFFYVDDEVVAVASERVALSNVFDVEPDLIPPIGAGHVLEIKRDGRIRHEPFIAPAPLRQCSFERIYFSRGNDPQIYRERKALGANLALRVLDAIDHDLTRTVFSYIPNTAETAYLGLIQQIETITRDQHLKELWQRIQSGMVQRHELESLMNGRLRVEKVAHKDAKIRTFITHDAARRDLVLHVYDITRGSVSTDDALIVVDDSIVRGTTLRESIITILSRLKPRKIIIVSSAPPIMYPDCYGIDMSQLGKFIAFEAAVALLHERGEEHVLEEVEQRCLEQVDHPPNRMLNHVKLMYDRFTLDELSAKVAQLARPKGLRWEGPVEVMYQSLDGLHAAMPEFAGDWYFTGDYPTPGGFRVLNTAFLNWRRKSDVRSY